MMRDVLSYIEIIARGVIFGGLLIGNAWLIYSWQ